MTGRLRIQPYETEGQLLETCKDLSTSERRPPMAELEGRVAGGR